MARRLLIAGGWLTLCLAGSYLAMGYEFRAGSLGPSLAAWPMDSRMVREADRSTILAFLHPRCPCTAGTVKQLLSVAAAHPQATLLVPIFVPEGLHDTHVWIDGDYAQLIRRTLPTAQIIPDWGGAEAQRFGALTSGTILVYNGAGQEIFRGGITNRRGGEEDNPGLQRFAQALKRGAPAVHAQVFPVFGCPLTLADRKVTPGGEK